MINALRMSPGASASIQLSGQVSDPLAQAPGASSNKGIALATQIGVAASSSVSDSHSPGAQSLPAAEARVRQNYVPRPSLAEEPNSFGQAFGDAIKETYSLAGTFPKGLQPQLSSVFLEHARAHPPEAPELQSVLDHMLDPGAGHLAYHQVPKMPYLACCVRKSPCVHAVLHFQGQEIIGIRLLGAGNKGLWEMTKPVAESGGSFTSETLQGETPGVKRKRSSEEEALPFAITRSDGARISFTEELQPAVSASTVDTLYRAGATGEAAGSSSDAGGSEGEDLVPKYDEHPFKTAALKLLQERPDITPAALLKELKVSPPPSRSWDTESACLCDYLRENGKTTRDFFTNYTAFVLTSEEYRRSPQGNTSPARKILNALEENVFECMPLEKRFSSKGLEASLEGLKMIQVKLVQRYAEGESRKKEKEIDAFVDTALDIKKDSSGKYSKAKKNLHLRPHLFPLDGDRELKVAYEKILCEKIFPLGGQNLQRERESLMTTLPEVSHKLKIEKNQLFSVIRNWSSFLLTVDASAQKIQKAVLEELPGHWEYVSTIMGQFAQLLPDPESTHGTSFGTSS